mgnify:FL=1
MFVYLLDKFTLFSIIGLSVVLGFWIISVFSKDENEKRKRASYANSVIVLAVIFLFFNFTGKVVKKDFITKHQEMLENKTIEISKDEYIKETNDQNINANSFYKKVKVFKEDVDFYYADSIDQEIIDQVYKPVFSTK